MAKKKKQKSDKPVKADAVYIENAGVVLNQPITETLRVNYMPYAMSVIVSRAIPEIDGFKPSQRKILYTMYKMGLLSGARSKSANVVGQVMRLNPHGDAAIYETMVRMARGCEALLHPYVDSKGNFGKAYSRDMAYAASRYTEVKLEALCAELFRDIDKDTVDFIDNYDNTTKEPLLLPVTFPSILVNSNVGIAVGMASSIASFNLSEICNATIALLKNPQADVFSMLTAPDFPGGGKILYNREELRRIFDTGRGSVRMRAHYHYDKANNCIDITQIPPSTTIEAIMDKTVEHVKAGRIKEIADMRDETDLSGLKITIDLKRGADPDKLMARLFKLTPLEDTFSCNFNILISGTPRVMGVQEIILEWIAFRQECVRRRVFFELGKKKERLHLLLGLRKILLDIDKAIAIVRGTEEEQEVIPNLMIEFGIDEKQADYVAEIKLRHLNREYILNRTQETEQLKNEIADMQDILSDPKRIAAIITGELREVMKKHHKERRSEIIHVSPQEDDLVLEEQEDYPVHLFFTREGYFKKITPQSLRMGGAQRLKEGDEIAIAAEGQNLSHLLFFGDKGQVYKSQASEFEDTKTSVMGDYIPARLGMDEGENALFMAVLQKYSGYMVFVFENGKIAKVGLESYETKTKRRKLVGAYNTVSGLAGIFHIEQDCELLLISSAGRGLIVHTGLVAPKTTRNIQGVQAMTLSKSAKIVSVRQLREQLPEDSHRLVAKSLPAAGRALKTEDLAEQLTL